jgi:hypothetical protein
MDRLEGPRRGIKERQVDPSASEPFRRVRRRGYVGLGNYPGQERSPREAGVHPIEYNVAKIGRPLATSGTQPGMDWLAPCRDTDYPV